MDAFSILSSIGEAIFGYLEIADRLQRRKLCKLLSDYYYSIDSLYDASIIYRRLINDDNVLTAAKKNGFYGRNLGQFLKTEKGDWHQDQWKTWEKFIKLKKKGKLNEFFRMDKEYVADKLKQLYVIEAVIMEEILHLQFLSWNLRDRLREMSPKFTDSIEDTGILKAMYIERRWSTSEITSVNEVNKILDRFKDTKENIDQFMRDICKNNV